MTTVRASSFFQIIHASQQAKLTRVLLTGFDLRPFLYPSRFPFQFRKIDEVAAKLPDRSYDNANTNTNTNKVDDNKSKTD